MVSVLIQASRVPSKHIRQFRALIKPKSNLVMDVRI